MGAGGKASAIMNSLSPSMRKSIASSTESLRYCLEGPPLLEDCGTPAPDGKGAAGCETKFSAESGSAIRGDGAGGGGNNEHDSEREGGEGGRTPTRRASSRPPLLTQGIVAKGQLRSFWEQFPLVTSSLCEMQGLNEPTS